MSHRGSPPPARTGWFGDREAAILGGIMCGGCRLVVRGGHAAESRRWFPFVIRHKPRKAVSIAPTAAISAVSVMAEPSASDAIANGDAGPPEWTEYVSAVGDLITTLGQKLLIFLVSCKAAADQGRHGFTAGVFQFKHLARTRMPPGAKSACLASRLNQFWTPTAVHLENVG